MFVHNPIDLLKFEHAILRVRYSLGLQVLNSDPDLGFSLIEETHRFVIDWHAYVEDKYVFPLIGEKAKPFSNDHLLIKNYGKGAIEQRRKDWIERYVKIVLDHNSNEERELFSIEADFMKNWELIISEMKKFNDYSKITGLKELP
ncbi:hemerythrin domain-containing protein [Metallosphaera sp.]|uniref:hemerythrin domain-containing protein n=1 Tax=Metallosphaera sp. TaxID=2020860 RepID=UPI00315F2062